MPYQDEQSRCGQLTRYGTHCRVATPGGPCHWHSRASTLRRELVGLDDLRAEVAADAVPAQDPVGPIIRCKGWQATERRRARAAGEPTP